MKRYFYTDPLAAAWMAKHHGMSLYIGDFEADDFDAYSQINWNHCVDDWQFKAKMTGKLPRFYVHPNSVHILNPKIGDQIVHGINGFVAHVYAVNESETYSRIPAAKPSQSNPCFIRNHVAGGLQPIVLRNDIPFHWPQVEDAA